jgi:hypothetical protein
MGFRLIFLSPHFSVSPPPPESAVSFEVRRPKPEAERGSVFGLLSAFDLRPSDLTRLRSSDFRAAEQDLPSTGRTLEPPCLPAKSARRIAPLIFARTNSGRQCPYSVRLSVAGRRQGGLRQWFLMARAACDGARVSELARGQWRQHAGSEIGVPGRDHGAGSRAAQVELASPVPAGQH